ncbi:hypothetical protein GCM10010099_23780 [Streptomyces cinereus]|nr:hypothetical protein GCM10010099_23780 [Streptomyces cinereus]
MTDTTDRAALRDRIAEALADATGARWPAQAFLTEADAVLGVLPEPADRAAVLREAADALQQRGKPVCVEEDGDCCWFDAVKELRRVAAEAQPTTKPERTCTCDHPADEHSVYGCADGCACEWMPKRRKRPPMDPVHILGIYADDEPAAGARHDKEA